MWTDDPVADYTRYDLECEKWREEWEATRPKCAECGAVLGEGYMYDISEGDLEEGYTFCETCVAWYFDHAEQGELNETIRSAVFDKFRRKLGA